MNERYLIINADDFGLCESMNQAVQELFRLGAITSSSILSPAPRAAKASALAAQQKLPAGVHWTLFSEWKEELWPAASLQGKHGFLTDNGFLPADGGAAAKRAASSDITRELEAQYLRMAAAGCIPDHADSHGGTLYGINGRLFFINAFRLCRKYGLPFRFARTTAFLERQFAGRVSPAVTLAHSGIVFLAERMGVALPDDFITNPYPVEKIRDYEALCRDYEEQLRIAPAGITEVFLHPSVPDGRLLARTPQWRKREWEYYFLKSGRLARLVEKEGFIPVSWGSAPFEELRRKAADFPETPHSRQQKQTIPMENINRRIKHYG